jgi:hypothetical protein
MNNTSPIPDENKIEELLARIQPIPSQDFHKNMEQASWQSEQVKPRMNVNKPRLKLALVMVVFLSITMIAVTPQGRALAQQVGQFFQTINSTTIDASKEELRWMNVLDELYDLPLVPVIIPEVAPEMAAILGCETPQKSQSYRCQVALAESELGFDMKELPEIPKDWIFKSLYFNTDSQSVTMFYDLDFQYTAFTSYSNLMFKQGIGDFSNLSQVTNSPWGVVPADKVQIVSIGKNKGEYVKGGFSLYSDDDKFVWNEKDREQRLAWSDGSQWYLIQYWPNLNIAEYWPGLNPTGTMSKEELLQLAESLVTTPIETAETINFDHLSSISDAEKVSGIDLKSPTLLPMDIDFYYARFLSDKKQVQLVYGINEDLIIYEWEGDPLDYEKPLGKYEYTCEILNMNGRDALYCFFESNKLRSFLWWHQDGINYQMYFNDSLISGGRIDREQMILIAKSMQDVDDFFKKGSRTYEQTAIYAQAAGIDLKKFSNVPSGWIYANFWSNAYSKCIDLIYTSTVGNSTLYVNQCGTDHRSNTSMFPSRSIERVKVGHNKGLLIAGGFSTTQDGKQVWDSSLPVKQLYWQNDELWMHITLSGDQAHILTKDEVIAIAESLR